MKSIALAILLSGLSSAAFASENDNEQKPLSVSVKLDAESDSLVISFVQTEMDTAICGMKSSRLSLQQPKSELLHPTAIGTMTFHTEVQKDQPCLMALGFNHGSVSIKLDDAFTSPAVGPYELIINGDFYGYVRVKTDGVDLVPTIPVLF